MSPTDIVDIFRKKVAGKPRLAWGKSYQNLPELDLLSIQKTSYQQFIKEGIDKLLEEVLIDTQNQ